MKDYEQYPLVYKRIAPEWYSFPYYHSLPKGTIYKSYDDPTYRVVTSYSHTVRFRNLGDWIEVVCEEEKQRIRYAVF